MKPLTITNQFQFLLLFADVKFGMSSAAADRIKRKRIFEIYQAKAERTPRRSLAQNLRGVSSIPYDPFMGVSPDIKEEEESLSMSVSTSTSMSSGNGNLSSLSMSLPPASSMSLTVEADLPAFNFNQPHVVSQAVAFGVSPPASSISQAQNSMPTASTGDDIGPFEVVSPIRVPFFNQTSFAEELAQDNIFVLDEALQQEYSTEILEMMADFDGLSSYDNYNLFGSSGIPPDTVGAVGKNYYVQMVNTAWSVYDKNGTQLMPPQELGAIWSDFAIEDCARNNGDPIVLYDQTFDRWILTQFTKNVDRGVFYNCVAVSQTDDPTGSYFLYAFQAMYFPDFPKYGKWSNSYVITTREYDSNTVMGAGIYALEKKRMIVGDPKARVVQHLLNVHEVPSYLMYDGLLSADIDGKNLPKDDESIPILGIMKSGIQGAPFDGINIWNLRVDWNKSVRSSLDLTQQLDVAAFNMFNCFHLNEGDCVPQPDVQPHDYLDNGLAALNFRLAYRNFGTYEVLVAVHHVEARVGQQGLRWYEIRCERDLKSSKKAKYEIFQQGTYAPNDGINRWMGSIAMDSCGNIALGFSVSNNTVYPGIRYTGRLAGDELGEMTLGEGVIKDGSGSQINSQRWGDYSSMTVDPNDDRTFYFTSEYIETKGENWKTRIASFELNPSNNKPSKANKTCASTKGRV